MTTTVVYVGKRHRAVVADDRTSVTLAACPQCSRMPCTVLGDGLTRYWHTGAIGYAHTSCCELVVQLETLLGQAELDSGPVSFPAYIDDGQITAVDVAI